VEKVLPMSQSVAKEKQIALLDMLDRILNKGVILWGDITISVADIDLVYVGLKVLLTSVETAQRMQRAADCGLRIADCGSNPQSKICNPQCLTRP
jgi:hypothetical protein